MAHLQPIRREMRFWTRHAKLTVKKCDKTFIKFCEKELVRRDDCPWKGNQLTDKHRTCSKHTVRSSVDCLKSRYWLD